MPGQVRSVTVRLSANSAGYVAGVRPAEAANARIAGGLDRIQAKSITTAQTMGRIGNVGKAIFLPTAAAIGATIKVTADYQAELSAVKSLSHATAGEMRQLDDAARTLGKGIGFTATEAAQGEQELVKAGISVKDILGGGLKGALDLAAAGQTDVGTSAEIASSAMVQFGLKGKDIPHIADLLAAGADKALGSVTDLGEGLKQVGTTSDQMGFSIEETVGTLAEFASAGLIGEKGGTTLKSMFLQLSAPTKQAKELLDKYNVSLYDAQGRIKPLSEIAGNLQKSFKDLDPATRNAALGIIFGSHAIQGANILIKDGEAINRKWTKSVDDQGFAADQAAGKMDNLKGDAKKLKSELQDAAIGQGGKQGFLRKTLQDVTDLIKKYNDLSDSQKSAIGKGVVGAAAVGGALYTANKIYQLAKGTSELYAGIRGGRKVAAAAGAAEGIGGRIGRGVVPVYVTNKGFGGDLPGGKPGVPPAAVPASAAATTGIAALLALAPFGAIPAESYNRKNAPSTRGTVTPGSGGQGGAGLPLGFFDFDESKADKAKKSLKDIQGIVDSLAGSAGVKVFGGDTLFGLKLPQFGDEKLRDYRKGLEKIDDAYADMAKKHPGEVAKELADKAKDAGVSFRKLLSFLPETNKQLGDYGSLINQVPKRVRTKVEALGAKATYGQVQDLIEKYDLTPAEVSTVLQALGVPKAEAELLAVTGAANDVPRNVPVTVKANIGGAIAALSAFGRYFNSFNGRVVTTTVRTNYTTARAPKSGGDALGGPGGLLNPGGRTAAPNPGGRRAGGGSAADPAETPAASFTIPGYSITAPSQKALDLAKQLGAEYARQQRTAKDVRADRADELHALQAISQLQRDLRAKGADALRGINRRAALADLAVARDQLREIRQAARKAIEDARKDSVENLTGDQTVFSRGASAGGAIRSVNKQIADVSQYGQVIAQLKAAGASPALLKQIIAQAESGDFRSAIRLGKALLAQPQLLTQLNTSLSGLNQVTAGVAGLTTDPRFLSGKPFDFGGVTPQVVQVNVGTLPSDERRELQRFITHQVRAELAKEAG